MLTVPARRRKLLQPRVGNLMNSVSDSAAACVFGASGPNIPCDVQCWLRLVEADGNTMHRLQEEPLASIRMWSCSARPCRISRGRQRLFPLCWFSLRLFKLCYYKLGVTVCTSRSGQAEAESTGQACMSAALYDLELYMVHRGSSGCWFFIDLMLFDHVKHRY